MTEKETPAVAATKDEEEEDVVEPAEYDLDDEDDEDKSQTARWIVTFILFACTVGLLYLASTIETLLSKANVAISLAMILLTIVAYRIFGWEKNKDDEEDDEESEDGEESSD